MNGIYKVRCVENDWVYVGQTGNLKQRWLKHCAKLRCGLAHDGSFQNDWNKYGEKGFEFSVIVENISEESLDSLERYWIAHYRETQPGRVYNKEGGGQANKHTHESTRKRLSAANMGHSVSDETRHKLVEAWKSRRLRPVSEETRKKLSDAWKPLSEEAKRKISEANRGRSMFADARRRMMEGLSLRWSKPISEETRRKQSEAHRGRVMSETTRRKMSETWKQLRRLKPISEKTRRKISEAKAGRCWSEKRRMAYLNGVKEVKT